MRNNMNGLLLVLIMIFGSCDKDDPEPKPEPKDSTYTNPIFNPVFADPAILDNRERDGYFYAYATQDKWERVATSEHIVPIIKSQDLINWEFVGDAFTDQPNWNIGENLVWAPDVEYRNGKYYMYYSLSVWAASNSAIGVAVSDTPEGPYTDLGKILDSKDSGVENSIDPYYYKDIDGKQYIFWGSFHGIYGVPLEEDGTTARLTEKFQIGGSAFEAVYIFKRENYYYLIASVGSCCDGGYSYHLTAARAENIKGPYLDINGMDIKEANDWSYGETDHSVNILYKTRTVVAPGHNSEIIVDDEGTEWILYHAIKTPDYTLPSGSSKRPLFIDKVIWSKNGWPKIGNNGFPTLESDLLPVFN